MAEHSGDRRGRGPRRGVALGAALFGFAGLLVACTGLPNVPSNAAGLSIGHVNMVEGDSGSAAARFPIRLSNAQAAAVTVSWETADFGATAGADYTAVTAGSTVIPAGATVGVAEVDVTGDTTVEGDELFTVSLTGVDAGLTITQPIGWGTIINDDGGAPAPRVGVGWVAITEGDAGTAVVEFPIRLSGAQPAAVEVTWTTTAASATAASATAPDDFTAASGTLILPAGTVVGYVPVTINADVAVEAHEVFAVTLTATDTPGVTIDPAVGFGTHPQRRRHRRRRQHHHDQQQHDHHQQQHHDNDDHAPAARRPPATPSGPGDST